MKIGIDVDEVLAAFLKNYCKYYNEKHKTNFSESDFISYDFWTVVGGTVEDVINSVHDFHETKYFSEIEPVVGAIEGVKEIIKGNELYAVSSRQDHLLTQTQQWLEKYFPKMFAGVFLVNNFAKGTEKRTKKGICEKLGIEVLIEDMPQYAEECASKKCKVIMLRKPWNKEFDLPGIIKVDGWKEIPALIEQLQKEGKFA
jgi:5'(3')-deoxyribonucleotidase